MSKQEASQPSLHPLAGLYQRSVLDPMVEVARTISHDFVKRPRHYRAVPENVASILEGSAPDRYSAKLGWMDYPWMRHTLGRSANKK